MPFQYKCAAVHYTSFQSEAHLWVAITGTGTVRLTPFDSWGSTIWGTIGMDPSSTSSTLTWGHSEITSKHQNFSETATLWHFCISVVKNPRGSHSQISRSRIWMNFDTFVHLCTTGRGIKLFTSLWRSCNRTLILINLVSSWQIHSDQWWNDFRFIPHDLLLIHKAEYYSP